MEQNSSSSSDLNSMEISVTQQTTTQTDENPSMSTNTRLKRKGVFNEKPGASASKKRSRLTDMIFYDGNPHPAAILHDLHPDISSDNYCFEGEPTSSKQIRFRCSLSIPQNASEPLIAIGIGRSKQLAKNMAAQVRLSD